jgi:hypothetical protein
MGLSVNERGERKNEMYSAAFVIFGSDASGFVLSN